MRTTLNGKYNHESMRMQWFYVWYWVIAYMIYLVRIAEVWKSYGSLWMRKKLVSVTNVSLWKLITIYKCIFIYNIFRRNIFFWLLVYLVVVVQILRTVVLLWSFFLYYKRCCHTTNINHSNLHTRQATNNVCFICSIGIKPCKHTNNKNMCEQIFI